MIIKDWKWIAITALFFLWFIEDQSRVSVQENIRHEIETVRQSKLIEVHLNMQMPEIKEVKGNRGFAR